MRPPPPPPSRHGAPGAGVRGHRGLRLPGLPPGEAAAGDGARAARAPRLRPPHRAQRPPPGPRAAGAAGGRRGGRGRRGAGAGGGRRRLPRGGAGRRVGQSQQRGHRPHQRPRDPGRAVGQPAGGRALARLHQQHGGRGAQHPRGPLPAGLGGDSVPDAPGGAVRPQQSPGRAPRPQQQRGQRVGGPPAGDAVAAPHGDLRGGAPHPRPVLPARRGALAAPNPAAPRRARPRLRRQRGLDAHPGGPRRPPLPVPGGRRRLLLLRLVPLRLLRGLQHVLPGRPGAAPVGLAAPRVPPGAGRPPQRPPAPPAQPRLALRPPPQPLHPGRGLHPLQRPHRQGPAPLRLPAALHLGPGPGTHRPVAQGPPGGVLIRLRLRVPRAPAPGFPPPPISSLLSRLVCISLRPIKGT